MLSKEKLNKLQESSMSNYGDVLCEDCKIKVANRVKKLGRFAMLRPLKMAKEFPKIICKECYDKMVERQKKIARGQ